MSRVAVPVVPVEGGHQAVCETSGCTAGPTGGPWRSEVNPVKAGALEQARWHRQWHRAQRPIPEEESMEKIAVLRVDGDGLGVIVRNLDSEQADRIATELLDAHGTGEELLLVRVRRGKLSLVDAVVPAAVAARTVAALDAVEEA